MLLKGTVIISISALCSAVAMEFRIHVHVVSVQSREVPYFIHSTPPYSAWLARLFFKPEFNWGLAFINKVQLSVLVHPSRPRGSL